MTSGVLQEVKEITDVVGRFGPWQRRMLIVIALWGFPSAWHTLGINFLAPDIDHWCARPYTNISVDEWKNSSIPMTKEGYSQCEMYGRDINETVPCDSWEYDKSFFTSTLIDQWDLVCSNSWLASLAQSVYMFGYLVSMLVMAQLSDRYGRRPLLLASLVLFLVPSILSVFMPTYTLFLIFRFLMSIGRSGFFMTSLVLFIEIIGPEQRSTMNAVRDMVWAAGVMSLPGVAWLIPNWKHFQLTITIPMVVFIAVWWVAPESPRWLLTQGKVEQAEDVVRTALKINNKEVSNLPEIIKGLMDSTRKEEEARAGRKNLTILDLLKTPNVRKKTIILCYMWCVSSFIFYGLSLNTGVIGGNIFMNTFYSGAAEFLAYLILYFIINRFGRRTLLLATTISGGIACIFTTFIPQEAVRWLAIFGKFCVAAAYNIVYLMTAEIHPTEVRNIGMGVSSMFARVGAMVAPFVRDLGRFTHPSFPLGLFGALFISSGVLGFVIPETLNQILPDTLEQAEKFGRKEPNKPTEK